MEYIKRILVILFMMKQTLKTGLKKVCILLRAVKIDVYKRQDKTQGTWYVSFRYIDWTGKKTQKLKRGFKTKKEALNYEKEFMRKTAADMKMEMGSFIEVYFEDKRKELKENSIRNKQHMMNKHIVPYFGTRKMNEITPADVIQWQNTIQEKGYSKTYERMIQNQLNALFNRSEERRVGKEC